MRDRKQEILNDRLNPTDHKVDICPECDGHGAAYGGSFDDPWRDFAFTCEACGGTGRVEVMCCSCGEPLLKTDREPECDDCLEANYPNASESTDGAL